MTYEEAFDLLWKAYPTQGRAKGSRKKALEAFIKLMKGKAPEKRKAFLQAIMGGVEAYTDYLKQHSEYNKDVVTWLNQHGWEDEYGRQGVESPVYVSPEKKAEIVRWKIQYGLMHMRDICWLEEYEEGLKKRKGDETRDEST